MEYIISAEIDGMKLCNGYSLKELKRRTQLRFRRFFETSRTSVWVRLASYACRRADATEAREGDRQSDQNQMANRHDAGFIGKLQPLVD